MATLADSAVREGQTAVSRRGDQRVRDVGRPAAGAGAERGEEPPGRERGPAADSVDSPQTRHRHRTRPGSAESNLVAGRRPLARVPLWPSRAAPERDTGTRSGTRRFGNSTQVLW